MKYEKLCTLVFINTILNVVRAAMDSCTSQGGTVYNCRLGDVMEFDCPHVSSKGTNTRVKWKHNAVDVITVNNGSIAAMNDRISNYKKPNRATVLFTMDKRLNFYYNSNARIFQLHISAISRNDAGLWECDVRIGDVREKKDLIINIIGTIPLLGSAGDPTGELPSPSESEGDSDHNRHGDVSIDDIYSDETSDFDSSDEEDYIDNSPFKPSLSVGDGYNDDFKDKEYPDKPVPQPSARDDHVVILDETTTPTSGVSHTTFYSPVKSFHCLFLLILPFLAVVFQSDPINNAL